MATIADRYSRAITSSNLKAEKETPGDIDPIIAAGWCANPDRSTQQQGRHKRGATSLASLLYRLRIEYDRLDKQALAEARGDPHFVGPIPEEVLDARARRLTNAQVALKDYAPTRDALRKFVSAHASRQHTYQAIGPTRLADIADQVLDHFLDSKCFTCNGIAFKPVPGTGRLSNTPCASCAGTGKRLFRFGRHTTKEEVNVVQAVQDDIERKLDSLDRLLATYLRNKG